jgi:hypothetical protein
MKAVCNDSLFKKCDFVSSWEINNPEKVKRRKYIRDSNLLVTWPNFEREMKFYIHLVIRKIRLKC